MRTPCDTGVQSAAGGVPCRAENKAWILAATILGSSMAFIDSTVVNVALPAIQTSFHATVVGVQWVVESYGLFLAALILVGGSLGDLFGRRRVFVAGVAIFAVASAVCGFASNIEQLISARSVQGVGAALLVPGSLAIISKSFDEKSRGQAIGTWSGFTAITTAVGPVLGGWLVEHASWRWAFFINLPLAAAVVAISLLPVPGSRSAPPHPGGLLGGVSARPRTAGEGERLYRGRQAGLEKPSGLRKFDRRFRLHDRVCPGRSPRHFSDGPARHVQECELHWRKPAYFIFIFCHWHFLLSLSAEPDPGAGILLNRNRGRHSPFDSVDVCSFTLVGWTRHALWRERPVDRWPCHCRAGFRFVCAALHGRQLLDDIFPGNHRSRIWHGDYCGSAHHGGDEFSGPGPRGRGFWDQQRGGPGRGCARHCRPWPGDGPGVQLPSESLIDSTLTACQHSS